MKNLFFQKIFLAFLFTSTVFFFYLPLTKYENVKAQGSISCYTVKKTTGDECKTIAEECQSGYVPPPGKCEAYGGSECPMSLSCISANATVTPRPSPTVSPPSCNRVGNKCCGSIPPMYCEPGSGLIPSNPNDTITCTYQQPATSTPNPLDPTCSSIGKPNYINTALGCIPAGDMNSFAAWLLSKAILIAGGIAFILMSIGVFQITTSAGDPKKVQAGSELITSTLSGLLFIILSVFLLKLIGVDVLHLPEFGQ